MGEQGAKLVLDRWIEDESFPPADAPGPIATAEMLDTDLDEHQREALRSLDWSLSDEELQELLDKHLYC
jgi:hypothetical protein